MNHRDKVGIERKTSKDDSTNNEDTLFMMLVVTVRLTSIDHPQIEGKFTAAPGGLTNVFYGCID
jgi:hypothetical protein